MTEPILTSTDSEISRSRPKGKPRLFDCPACGGSIKLNAVGHSIRAVCIHCGSHVDTSNENLRLIQRMNEKLRPSLIRLGTYGMLHGKRWQVIGWMEKQDPASRVIWDEYLLFNPFYGFRFLIRTDGHWTLLVVIKHKVAAPAGQIKIPFDGRSYELFQDGKVEVTYVAGEFYWEVARGETSTVRDYIAPPFLLSVERADGEINVAHGEYLDPRAVAITFGLGSPEPIGIAPNQPSPYAAAWQAIKVPGLVFMTLALLIQIGAVMLADNETLLARNVVISAASPDKSLVIPALRLSDGLADVVVETDGRLNNQWMEIDFELINEQTEQSYKFRNAMELYSGRDGGSTWSEGSNSTDAVLTTVPGGSYTLVAEMDSGPPTSAREWVWSLRVRRDVALWENFWTVLGLGMLVPLYLLMRYRSFEKKRWSQSDYAPAAYRD